MCGDYANGSSWEVKDPPLACPKLQDIARLDDLRIAPVGVNDTQFPVLFARNGERNLIGDENRGDPHLTADWQAGAIIGEADEAVVECGVRSV